MIDFNRFIDRSRPGRGITQGGFTSHAQACARMEGENVVFLLLQGRQLDVRAHWARFLDGTLPHYNPLPGEDVYHKTAPIAVLPSGAGIEVAVVHRALVPGHLPNTATHFFTFGPPHFGLMFQAILPAPMPSQWEPVIWDLGQEAGLVQELRDTWNVRLWLVRIDVERWRHALANCPHLPPYEPGDSPEIPEP